MQKQYKKVGCDFDHVPFPFIEEYLKYHKDLFGDGLTIKDIHSYHLWEVLGGTPEYHQGLIPDFYHSGALANIAPHPYAQKTISMMSKWSTLFNITSRSEEMKGQPIMLLEKHFPQQFEALFLTNTYGRKISRNISQADVCLDFGIDLMIDDHVQTVLECAQVGIDCILFGDYGWTNPRNLPPNVVHKKNWFEVYNHLAPVRLPSHRV